MERLSPCGARLTHLPAPPRAQHFGCTPVPGTVLVGKLWRCFSSEWRLRPAISAQVPRTRDYLPGRRGPIFQQFAPKRVGGRTVSMFYVERKCPGGGSSGVERSEPRTAHLRTDPQPPGSAPQAGWRSRGPPAGTCPSLGEWGGNTIISGSAPRSAICSSTRGSPWVSFFFFFFGTSMGKMLYLEFLLISNWDLAFPSVRKRVSSFLFPL